MLWPAPAPITVRIPEHMLCPLCSYDDSRVTDSRMVDAAIRRRRECLRCNGRFTTYERVQPAVVTVVKKDGRREEFSREKLLAGVRKACEKRPLPPSRITALVDEVEAVVLGLGQVDASSTRIGELVMRLLRQVDELAYVRFASVCRSFPDITSMRDALDELQQTNPQCGVSGGASSGSVASCPDKEPALGPPIAGAAIRPAWPELGGPRAGVPA